MTRFPALAILLLASAAFVVLVLLWQPSPPPKAPRPPPSAGRNIDPSPADALQRLLSGDFPRLTPEQIAAYVKSRGSSALSLIAAWQLSRDPSWLDEAARLHPDDPTVAMVMLTANGFSGDASWWADVLKRSDADNALGPLAAAKAALDGGRHADALAELSTLEGLSRLDLPMASWTSAMTDAYHSAGYRGLEAEWAAMAQLALPWSDIRKLNTLLANAMSSAAASGDREAATRFGTGALKAAALLNHPNAGTSLLNQLLSLSMERQLLHQLDAYDLLPGEPQLVVERLSEMDTRTSDVKALIAQSQALLPTLTDSEARQYTRRVQVEGELKALRWLVSQRRTK